MSQVTAEQYVVRQLLAAEQKIKKLERENDRLKLQVSELQRMARSGWDGIEPTPEELLKEETPLR